MDINVFTRFISELTDKNFVLDQRVKGKVTINTPSKISIDEAYKVFESVFDVHGFAIVETGRLIKIIPSLDARINSIIMVANEDDTKRIRSLVETLGQEIPKGKEKMQVTYLEYAALEEIVNVLKDLPRKNNTQSGSAKETTVVSDKVMITADKNTNSLIITADRDDYATRWGVRHG